jgi:hypothetical protein
MIAPSGRHPTPTTIVSKRKGLSEGQIANSLKIKSEVEAEYGAHERRGRTVRADSKRGTDSAQIITPPGSN